MAWYAYCITEQQAFLGDTRARRPFPIPDLKGISGSQVFGYPSGEFAIIVSEYVPNGTINQVAVREHSRVVSSCFERTTVLPFRFGTVFENDEALRRAVRTNRKQFLASVTRLRGKAEMHVKVLVKEGMVKGVMDDVALSGNAGGEYLSQLRVQASRQRDRQTKARALTMQMNKILHPLEEEVSCRRTEDGRMSLDIAHLIEHAHLEKYQNRFNSAATQIKGCELVVTGPWPPYHFMPVKLRTVNGNS